MKKVILFLLFIILPQSKTNTVLSEEELRYGTSEEPVYYRDEEDEHFLLTTTAEEVHVTDQDIYDRPPITTADQFEEDNEDHTPPEHQNIGSIERILAPILKKKKK